MGEKMSEQKLTRPFVCVCAQEAIVVARSSSSSRSLLYHSVYSVCAN